MIMFDFAVFLLFVMSFAIGRIVVTKLYNVYMRIMNVDIMYIRLRIKLIHYIIAGGIIWVLVLKILLWRLL